MSFGTRIRNVARTFVSLSGDLFPAHKPAGAGIVFIAEAIIGLGAFIFIDARGFSCLSANPEACINCQVMKQVFGGWMSGDHRHVAGCSDCRLTIEDAG